MSTLERRIYRLKAMGMDFFTTSELLDKDVFEPVDTKLIQNSQTRNMWMISDENIFGKDCHGIVKMDGTIYYVHLTA